MQVLFNAKNLLGNIAVIPEIKLYYERVIQIIAEDISILIDTSNLEQIIIPDNFVSDVIEFQKSLNMENPSVTENEFGRACGKLLHDTETGKYYVFIDSNIATFLMIDAVLNAYFNNPDEATMKTIQIEKSRALNLLAHELAHIEFANTAILPKFATDFESQLESLLYSLFDEYYACRRAALISSEYIASYDEKYIIDIEQKIIDLKWNYKTHEMELTDFCHQFHALTRQALIGMVSVLGSHEEDEVQMTLYENCRLSIIINEFKIEFDRIYSAFVDIKTISINASLTASIYRYCESFGVYISKHPEGIYYHIPD